MDLGTQLGAKLGGKIEPRQDKTGQDRTGQDKTRQDKDKTRQDFDRQREPVAKRRREGGAPLLGGDLPGTLETSGRDASQGLGTIFLPLW